MSKIDVLDKGFVRLVSYMGSDLAIVRAARVSYDADWRAGEDIGSDTRLISYLLKHKHTSPFEAVVFTFEVKAPLFIFRQWHRHRTWSYNEVSARYTEIDGGFYVPRPEHIGTQSASNKQGRVFTDEAEEDIGQYCSMMIEEHANGAFEKYQRLLEVGCPRELARSVLPLNTYSRMFATVDLHNLMGFLRLRLDLHAQWEIQQYAKALLELAGMVCPYAIAEFSTTLSLS